MSSIHHDQKGVTVLPLELKTMDSVPAAHFHPCPPPILLLPEFTYPRAEKQVWQGFRKCTFLHKSRVSDTFLLYPTFPQTCKQVVQS